MNCDRCDKPAVVHEVIVKAGQKTEVHLCEEHAAEAGITMPTYQPINKLLTQLVVSKPGKSQRAGRKKCPTCGLSFAHVRQNGILGCPDCYRAFEKELTPLIERSQNGGTSHVGKSPKRVGPQIHRQLLIQRLVRELDSAVAAEQYEQAARLRDRLKELEVHEVPGGGETVEEEGGT